MTPLMILTNHLSAELLRLGMTSHSKSHVRVPNPVRVFYILVDGDLVERRHEAEQGENLSLGLRVENRPDAEHEELTEAAKGAELLEFRRFSNCAVYIEDEGHEAGVQRGLVSAA